MQLVSKEVISQMDLGLPPADETGRPEEKAGGIENVGMAGTRKASYR
jgi:hypothetical protein